MLIQPDMTSILSGHDVVYESPPLEGWEAFPLGNGSFGGPLWTTPRGWIFQANHTDAYELPNFETGGEGGAKWMVLRSCGRLELEYSVPNFDWLYLNDFRARLGLHDATAHSSARTAFGRFELDAFVHARRPVAALHHRGRYAGDLAQSGATIRISLERWWGSRVCGWWYHAVQGGAGVGLGEASCRVEGADACLDFSFRGGRVSLRTRVVGAAAEAKVLHSHRAELTVPAAPEQNFTILLACVTSHDSPDPPAAAKAALDDAAAEPELAASHRTWWEQHWQRSFLELSNDYFENLSYLHLYLMGSSSRGRYPPLFNGGLWIWNRDVRNWVHPHIWNQQQSFWCLPAANRCDLMRPLLDTYHRLMPEAIAATKRRGFEGMLWIDHHDFAGRQFGEQFQSFRENYTPASQLALLFWQHYHFSGDERYLREKGYPFMAAAGDFYLGFLRWLPQEDRYQVPLATTYEDERGLKFTDSITNLAMARSLFPKLIEASEILKLDVEKRQRWQHVLQHLPPYLLNDRDAARGVTLASGLVDGKTLPDKEDHNHGPIMCPVFPAGDLGLKDRGTAAFDAAQNTVATYSPLSLAITPTAIVAARLGMSEEAERRLVRMVRNLQHFPNGCFFNIDHWYTLSRRAPAVLQKPADYEAWAAAGIDLDQVPQYQRDYLDDRGAAFRKALVIAGANDGVAEHGADLPAWPFSQMGMESLGNFAAALQEVLLQSHEGVIRVFPATPAQWDASFTLAAEGGFQVSSTRSAGEQPSFIQVLSQRGQPCAVAVPWPGATQVRDEQGREVKAEVAAAVVRFETRPNGLYTLLPAGAPMPKETTFHGKTNHSPKTFFEATLGKLRNY